MRVYWYWFYFSLCLYFCVHILRFFEFTDSVRVFLFLFFKTVCEELLFQNPLIFICFLFSSLSNKLNQFWCFCFTGISDKFELKILFFSFFSIYCFKMFDFSNEIFDLAVFGPAEWNDSWSLSGSNSYLIKLSFLLSFILFYWKVGEEAFWEKEKVYTYFFLLNFFSLLLFVSLCFCNWFALK